MLLSFLQVSPVLPSLTHLYSSASSSVPFGIVGEKSHVPMGTERVNAGTRMGEQAFQLLMARAGSWGEQSLPLEKVDSILLA